jgi:hypothetical protein
MRWGTGRGGEMLDLIANNPFVVIGGVCCVFPAAVAVVSFQIGRRYRFRSPLEPLAARPGEDDI